MKSLKVFDLVLLNLVAVISLRWLASAGASGPASISLWILAAFFFFIPEGLAVAELSSRFPGKGGLYQWTKSGFGDWHGFVCGWCYWINNVLYFPSLLLFVSANVAFGLQTLHPEWQLEHSKSFVVVTTLATLWSIALISIVGLRVGRIVQNVGGIADWMTAVIIIGLGVFAFYQFGSANVINVKTMTPSLGNLSQLSFFAQICFALAGLELVSFFGGEVKEPRRISVAIVISCVVILAVYLIGTLAILVSVPAAKLTAVNGILMPVKEIGDKLHIHWAAGFVALTLVIAHYGGVSAWFTGSARVPYLVGVDKFLPRGFSKVHPKYGTPYVSILVQTILATLLTLFATAGVNTHLETAYKLMVDMCLILYFIPYCYLFLSLRKLKDQKSSESRKVYRVPGGNVGNWLACYLGLATTVLAIATTALPPDGKMDYVLLAKTFGGALILLGAGAVFYLRSKLSKAR